MKRSQEEINLILLKIAIVFCIGAIIIDFIKFIFEVYGK